MRLRGRRRCILGSACHFVGCLAGEPKRTLQSTIFRLRSSKLLPCGQYRVSQVVNVAGFDMRRRRAERRAWRQDNGRNRARLRPAVGAELTSHNWR